MSVMYENIYHLLRSLFSNKGLSFLGARRRKEKERKKKNLELNVKESWQL